MTAATRSNFSNPTHLMDYGASHGMNGYKQNSTPGKHPGHQFSFTKRHERVDWRKIAALDLHRVATNLDFQALQDNIANVTFCDIESELDISEVDPNFIKLFKLGQLTIEYLLHSQEYLSDAIVACEDRLHTEERMGTEVRSTLERTLSELTSIKKESHRRKKMLAQQQQLLDSGANNYHKCPHCPKAFINVTFLQNHLLRRHSSGEPAGAPLGGMDLRGVPVVEGEYGIGSGHGERGGVSSSVTALEKELEEIRNRLTASEDQLKMERKEWKLAAAEEKHTAALYEREQRETIGRCQAEQETSHREEIEKTRNMFMKELKEVHEKYTASQKALEDIQRHPRFGGSNVGLVVDEENVAEERALLQEQRQELTLLKEQLTAEILSVDGKMQTRFEEQDRKWKQKVKELKKSHKEEVGKLEEVSTRSAAAVKRAGPAVGGRLSEKRVSESDMEVEEEFSLEDEEEIVPQTSGHHQVTRALSSNSAPERPPAPVRSPLHERDADRQPTAREPRNREVESRVVVPPKIVEVPPSTEGEEEEGTLSGGIEESRPSEGTLLETFDSYQTQSTADLSLTTRHEQLKEAIMQNPAFITGLKKELSVVVDLELTKRGVDPRSTSMSTKVFELKMQHLKNERMKKAAKYKAFTKTRQECTEVADQRLTEKMGSNRGVAAPPKPGHTVQFYEKRRSGGSRSPLRRSADLITSQTQSSFNTTGGSSSRWESSEEEEESGEDDIDARRAALPQSRRTQPKGEMRKREAESTRSPPIVSPRNTLVNSASSRATVPRASPPSYESSPEAHDTYQPTAAIAVPSNARAAPATTGSDVHQSWDSDTEQLASGDDDDDDGEKVGGHGDSWKSSSQARQSGTAQFSYSTPKPKGQIAEMARSIELQLSGRSGHKPAGSIDTLEMPKEGGDYRGDGASPLTPDIPSLGNEQDDLDISLSSIEEDRGREPKRPIPSTRTGSGVGGDLSNTEGTSLWGTSQGGSAKAGNSSGAAARIHQTGSATKGGEGSDWTDSDLDLDDL